MKIEIGAGERPAEGFLALDLNPRTADVLAGALELPFRDGSIAEIRAVDVLEHISYRHTDLALREWARVLEPAAPIYVQVPDAHQIMRWYVHNDARLQHTAGGVCSSLWGASWRLLGGHDDGRYADAREGDDWRWNAHYSLWSRSSLRQAMEAAGFYFEQPILSNGHPNLLAHARLLRGVS